MKNTILPLNRNRFKPLKLTLVILFFICRYSLVSADDLTLNNSTKIKSVFNIPVKSIHPDYHSDALIFFLIEYFDAFQNSTAKHTFTSEVYYKYGKLKDTNSKCSISLQALSFNPLEGVKLTVNYKALNKKYIYTIYSGNQITQIKQLTSTSNTIFFGNKFNPEWHKENGYTGLNVFKYIFFHYDGNTVTIMPILLDILAGEYKENPQCILD